MIISKIELLNFRQFYGKQEISFAGKDDNDCQLTTVIYGKDGTGKAGLCRALFFCLYGEKCLDTDLESNDCDNRATNNRGICLVNTFALKEDALGDRKGVEAYVRVSFIHRGLNYEMFRALSGIQENDGKIVEQMEDLKLTMTDGRGKVRTWGLPEKEKIKHEINAMLDSHIKGYFFFDKKQIEKLMDPARKPEVRALIKKILRVEEIYLAEEAFRILEKKLLDELSNIPSDDCDKMVDERSTVQKLVADLTEQKDSIEKKLVPIRMELQHLDAKRDEFKEAFDLVGELKAKEDCRQGLIEKKREIMQDFQQFMPTAVQLLTRDLLAEIYQDIDDKMEKGQATPEIKKELIGKILSEMTCICGREVTLDSKEYTRLLQWAEGPGEALSYDVVDAFTYIGNTIHFLNGKLEDLFRLLQQISDIDTEYSLVTNRLGQIKLELAKFPATEVLNSLGDERNHLIEQKAEYEDRNNRLSDDLAMAEFKLLELESGQKKKAKERFRYKEVQEMHSVVARTCEVMKTVVAECSGAVITALEQEINNNFQNLAFPDSRKNLGKIVVTADYSIQVHDSQGRPFSVEALNEFREIIAMSVAIAFAQVASGDHILTIPVFVDFLPGLLTKEHQGNILKYLASIAPQWILFANNSFKLDAGERLFRTGRWGKFYLLEAVSEEVTRIKQAPVEAYQTVLCEHCEELDHDNEQRL